MSVAPRQLTPPRSYIAPFAALGWQIAPWRDESLSILLTGSAGGGKSRLAAEKLHGFCLRYPNAMALMLRKVKVSMTSGAVLMMARTVVSHDPRVRHVPSKSRFEYTNGSILAYGGLEDDAQRERLKSIGQDGGLDIVWMEEATEFDESDYNAVLARMRGKAAPWRQIILSCNPDAPTHWIKHRLIDSGESRVYYSKAIDNLYNPEDYRETLAKLTGVEAKRLVGGEWVQATGLVYDVWSDGPQDGNVQEAADYIPDGGAVIYGVDDGYVGSLNPLTHHYTANSHPRVFLLCQLRPNGQLCVFEEDYAVSLLSEQHIADVLKLPYPAPDYAVVDKSAAELKGRLHAASIYTKNGASDVEESVKVLRDRLAPDINNVRRLLVHPRCRHLRAEFASYRREDGGGKPVKEYDHGPDVCRYLAWVLRYD